MATFSCTFFLEVVDVELERVSSARPESSDSVMKVEERLLFFLRQVLAIMVCELPLDALACRVIHDQPIIEGCTKRGKDQNPDQRLLIDS